MPSQHSKVVKHVHKKKGAKISSLHENSRDAKRIRNASARDERVANMHSTRQKQNRTFLDRIAFFQDRLPETLHPLSVDEIKSHIEEYISRYDEELATLKSERRPGRPASTRQALLEQAVEKERQEFESGFWLPDCQDESTLMKLDGWKGQWLELGVMRFVRIDKEGVMKESSFPPRGAS